MSGDPFDGIAIIGMACRLPGADTPGEFWRNLCAGVESVRFFSDDELIAAGIPRAHLDDPRYVKASPILRDVDAFDAAFFGCSPREAAIMDPQQRLFLETCWAALEDAGYDPSATAPAVVGVFAGAGSSLTSYLVAHAGHPDLQGQTAGLQHITNDKDFLATRVSYKLNLTGPSLTVQTACSTSLVAVHLACQSLLNGECDMALAGASTIRIPHISGYLAEPGSVQSPDGHCRAFDAAGGGTIFGSGVAAVVLKDLRAARAAGDHVYAVIKGTAINNDGAAKMSYAAASVTGQARAMVEALDVAQVAADTVGYVECHATGTPAGDPIEVQALTRAFRVHTDRRAFCAIGSVKTNIGHPEQTAGLAGVIKAALALRHGQIPRSVHFSSPNPNLGLDDSPFYVPTQTMAWPRGAAPRRAAVNSLGIGGTNAFLVLEEAPEEWRLDGEPPPPARLVCLSAKSDEALRRRAHQFATLLGEASADALDDIVYTINVSRTGMSHRLACLCTGRPDLRDALERVATGTGAPDGTVDGISSGRNEHGAAAGKGNQPHDARLPLTMGVAHPRSVAFLFSGQGAQYPGMSAELYRVSPRFRDALDECEALLRPWLDRSLFDVLFAEDGGARLLDETGFTQPGLFAVEYALARLWQSWGIVPDAVMGHSLGELAAACVAGVFDLAGAASLVAQRAALMQALPPGGGMEVCFTDEATVRNAIEGVGGAVDIAAINSPTNTVVSGERRVVDEVRRRLAARGVASRSLPVSHAFHSPLVEPILQDVERVAAAVPASTPRLTLVSNVTGRSFDASPPASYWATHARRPVSFLVGMRTLRAAGCSVFVEIGPGRSTLAMGRECLEDANLVWLPSLDRARGDWRTLLESLGRLYVEGRTPDFRAVGGAGRRRVALPTYPFERKRYWLRDVPSATQVPPLSESAASGQTSTPFLVPASPGGATAVGWSLDSSPYLADHRVYGLPVIPTAAAADVLLRAARERFGPAGIVEDFVCHDALLLSDAGRAAFRLSLTPSGPERLTFRLQQAEEDERGTVGTDKVTGVLRRGSDEAARETAAGVTPAALAGSARFPEEIDADRYYAELGERGLEYGPSFRAVRRAWRGGDEAIGQIRIPASLAASASGLHPTLLDACLHLYPVLLNGHAHDGSAPGAGAVLHLPTGFDRLVVHRPHASEVWAHLTLRQVGRGEAPSVVDVRMYDDLARPVAALEGLTLRPIPQHALAVHDRVDRTLYHVVWEQRPLVATRPAPEGQDVWLVLADRTGLAERLARAIEESGDTCHLVHRSAGFSSPAPCRWTVDARRPGHFERLLASVQRAAGRAPRAVLHLWALDAPPADHLTASALPAAESIVVRSALGLVKAATRSSASEGTRLWTITRGAQRVLGHESAHPVQAILWGFARTAAIEAPRAWGGIIDLAPGGDPLDAEADVILRCVANGRGEQQIAVRGEATHVARLAALDRHRHGVEPIRVREDRTYLITGGLGMLGLAVARWLVVGRGARTLALVGRRGPTADARRAIAALEAAGARVVVLSADVSKAADVARLFRRLDDALPPIAGIVHCAGVLADGILERMTWAQFARATAPKAQAAWLLHQHTLGRELDLFQLHSSVLSLTGSPGQANYTSANAFLDALADHRLAMGLPATVINWGPWADAGMAAHAGARGEALWRARGMDFIQPELGVQVLDRLFDRPAPHAAVAVCDWPRFVDHLQAAPAFYAQVLPRTESAAAMAGVCEAPVSLRARLEAAAPAARHMLVLGALRAQVAVELGLDGDVDTDRPLPALGIDSLMSVGLSNRLQRSLDVRVPVARLIRGPSLAELASELVDELTQSTSGGGRARSPGAPSQSDAPTAPSGIDDASAPTPTATRVRPWLVRPRPRPAARVRLVCFNFAGGGAATYLPWADLLDPAIELLAVEPPGRATRLDEPPITRVEALLDGLVPDLLPYLDRPCAMFGHCLGGLNLFEVARHLLREHRIDLPHLFLSGSRPPHRLTNMGRFEEDLLTRLLQDPGFDPSLPFHQQGDDTFASVIRQFNIGASDDFLSHPELRRLVLPAVRADFETVWRYRPAPEPPWDVPITCFTGLDDRYVTREDAMEWHRYTRREFRIHFRPGDHFLVVDDREFIVGVINQALA